MRGVKKQRTNALIRLMDDPDTIIFEAIEEELLKEKPAVIPELEKIWETTRHEICQIRIENLINKIRFKENFKHLRNWSRQSSPDLLEGFMLVSKYHYPDLNEERIFRRIEEIRKKVWVEINNSLTSLEKITVLNHIFFNGYGFNTGPENGLSPQYCFINQLLENQTGNAVSVALLYNIIALRLNLPVRYVDLPRNPMLAYVDRRIAAKVHPPGVESDILFYINPASNGSITGRKELEYYMKKMNYNLSLASYEASSPRCFMLRLLEVMEKSYNKSGLSERATDIQKMITLLDHKKKKPFP